jgi:nicotinamide-nucleotide amidase
MADVIQEKPRGNDLEGASGTFVVTAFMRSCGRRGRRCPTAAPMNRGTTSPWWLAAWLLALAAPSVAASAEAPPPPPGQSPVRYMIVVTGSELLAGVYPDGHTVFLTRTLRPLGLVCVGSMCVDDSRAEIEDALRFAVQRAALVIVTGGLGPTENDVTRETLSDFTGIALREQPEVLAAMARRFGVGPDQLRENLRRQTRVPVRGTYLKNPNGTAVGLVFEEDEKVIVALPGPPRELQAVVREELVPYLSRRFGTRPPGCSMTLRFVGLGQSQIDQVLRDHSPLPPDMTIFSQFEGGRVDFTFLLPDDTPRNRARLDDLKQKILEHLGDFVYADDETTLEERVAKLLAARGERLAIAEVGSGGGLAAALGGTELARDVLAGAFVAPSEQALRRMLGMADEAWAGAATSGGKAGLLALRTAHATGGDWAIVVGEVRRDQSGAGSMEVVFRRPDGSLETEPVSLRASGELAHARLTTELLDRLRRKLK